MALYIGSQALAYACCSTSTLPPELLPARGCQPCPRTRANNRPRPSRTTTPASPLPLSLSLTSHASSCKDLRSSRACHTTGTCFLLSRAPAASGLAMNLPGPPNPSPSSSSSGSNLKSITTSAANVSQSPALQKQRQQNLQWRPVVYVVTSEDQEEEEEENRGVFGQFGVRGRLPSKSFTIPAVGRREEPASSRGRNARDAAPVSASLPALPVRASLPTQGKSLLGSEGPSSRNIPRDQATTAAAAASARAAPVATSFMAKSKSLHPESRAAAAASSVGVPFPGWGDEGGAGTGRAKGGQRETPARTEGAREDAAAGGAAAEGDSVKAELSGGLRNSDSDLALKRALPLPMTTPQAKPMSLEQVEEQLNCDPEIQNCKEPVYEWTSVCTQCQGTGFYTPRSSSRRRGKGNWSSSQGFKCITCCGLGAVFRYTVRDNIPVMDDVDRTRGRKEGS